jgi:magnesium transporter
VIVDCAHYQDGRRQHQGPMELGRAAEICLKDNGFVWLGLFEPDQAELGEVQKRFGLHARSGDRGHPELSPATQD